MAHRREGQTTKDEVKQRDLEQELEEKERKHFSTKEREREIAGDVSLHSHHGALTVLI